MLAKKPKGAVQKRQGGGVASLLWMFVGAILTVMCLGVLYLWNPFDLGSETKAEQKTVEPINQPKSETNDFEFYDLLPDQEMISVPDEAVFDQDTQTTTAPDVLQPDVVVTTPSTQTRDNSIQSIDDLAGVQDNSTQTPVKPNAPAASGDNDIVIVEEEGTYDDPTPSTSSGNQTSQSTGQANRVTQAGVKPAAASRPPSYILQINSFSSADEADKRRAQVLMAGVDAKVVKSKMNNGQVFYQVVSPTMTSRQNVVSAQQKLQNNGIDSLIVEQRR